MKRPGPSKGNSGPSEGVAGRAKRTLNTDGIDLEFLTVDDLLVLRDRVTKALSSRIETERRDLESRLARLKRADFAAPFRLAKGGRVIGGRATVAPKYRNPDNPSETWSGRGRKPRWMTDAMKAGKKLRDFEIAMLFVPILSTCQLVKKLDIFAGV